MRRLRRDQEPEYGEVELNMRMRRALRLMLREPERPWTMAEFNWVTLRSPVALQDVIDRLCAAASGSVEAAVRGGAGG